MKAMILSAGFGTRLLPHTLELPKALVPHKSIPMINYQMDRLKNIGVNEVVVNAHHHSDKMIDYFNKNDFKVKINIIVEEEILGTGGGILNANKYLANDDFFLVINVDVDTDLDLSGMLRVHKFSKPFATLAVQKRTTQKHLEFDNDMNLAGRVSIESEEKNLYAFNGIHIISNRIFRKGFEIYFKDIFEIYLEVIKNKDEFIKGYNTGNSSFKDLGKVENLEN